MSHDPTLTVRDEARERFEALVRSRSRAPFVWGQHDCCMWAADAVLAKTGVDLAAEFRGTYSTAMGALRLVDQLGGVEAIGARVGPEIPPLMATWGDVGMVKLDDDRELLCVCSGSLWLGTGDLGMTARPMHEAHKAWRANGY